MGGGDREADAWRAAQVRGWHAGVVTWADKHPQTAQQVGSGVAGRAKDEMRAAGRGKDEMRGGAFGHAIV